MDEQNPAKVFLRQYISTKRRVMALEDEINEMRERATGTTIRLKPISVQGGGGAYDRMAEDVSWYVDMQDTLFEEVRKAKEKLTDVLQAVDSVQDERQKTLLTLRYIRGYNWQAIMDEMHFEKTQCFVIHGWALLEINKWLKVRTKTE